MKKLNDFFRLLPVIIMSAILVFTIISAFGEDYASERVSSCFKERPESDVNVIRCIEQGTSYYGRWVIQEGGKLFGSRMKFRFFAYSVGIIAAFYIFFLSIWSIARLFFLLFVKKKEDGGEQQGRTLKIIRKSAVLFINTLAIVMLSGFFIGFFDTYASKRLFEDCSHLNYKCLIPSYVLANRQMQELSFDMVGTRFFLHGIVILLIVYVFYDLYGATKSLRRQKKKEEVVKDDSEQ